jgi:hypothetical protein
MTRLARARTTSPSVHNGSVPTLEALLLPGPQRPTRFFVGCQSYDPRAVGYACTSRSVGAFEYDTSLPSNSNLGHEFGTDLSRDDRRALIEFVKSIEQPAAPPLPEGGLCNP